MSHILVTGASGFIGRQLCVELLRRGHQVRAAVRAPCRLPDGVEQVTVGAIDGATYWSAALRDIDIVIHLAARVHVMKDKSADPLAEFLKVNLLGTANLAQQAAAGARRLVYVSSIKVNGEQTRNGQSFSEQDLAAPRDPYGISKWQAEQALRNISRMTRLEVVIVRPPLVYGPGVKGNFLRLMAAIDRGVPLPLSGAHNLRSMLYAGNLVDVLIACASHPAAAGRTYLVGDGEDVIDGQTGRNYRPCARPQQPVVLSSARTVACIGDRAGTQRAGGQAVRFIAGERSKDTPRTGLGSPVFDGAGHARHGGLVSHAA